MVISDMIATLITYMDEYGDLEFAYIEQTSNGDVLADYSKVLAVIEASDPDTGQKEKLCVLMPYDTEATPTKPNLTVIQ